MSDLTHENPLAKLNRQASATIEAIQFAVASEFGTPMIDMASERRARDVARPRQVAMYLCRHLTPFSLPRIGRAFGYRDHTTVMHAVTTVTRLMAESEEFGGRVAGLRDGLQLRNGVNF